MVENVNIVRLVTGEEIVCQLTTIQSGEQITYNIKEAAILLPNPADGRLMFGRWLPYVKAVDGITVDSKFVMFITEPSEDLKQHYITTIVNNLSVPARKLVEPGSESKLKLTID
jgi:hypothetical protein